MSSAPYRLGLPVYDNATFAMGCDAFILKAKTPEKLYDLMLEVVAQTPDTHVVKGYTIGVRPDYPVPVAMWFMELEVRSKEELKGVISLFWNISIEGGLETCSNS